MSVALAPKTDNLEVIHLRVARAIAADIYPLETILKHHSISPDQWLSISENPAFRKLLESEIQAWHSATNTTERVRLKSAAFIEEALPELYARVHDKGEALNHKVEALKLVRDLAGFVRGGGEAGVTGERFSVTINLGADHQLTIEKSLTPQVIDVVSEYSDEPAVKVEAPVLRPRPIKASVVLDNSELESADAA